MGIADLFRPKYRHSNADVRAEAVRQLGPEDVELVSRLAREDSDASVRRIALGKIEDPDVLADLARSESDRALRELAQARASGIWVSRAVAATRLDDARGAISGLKRLGDQRALADVASRAELIDARDTALGAIDDDKALAELARHASTHVAGRSAALARIRDPEILRSIAVDEAHKDIAMAAVERIEDAAMLDAVATKAKNKAVRARARKKLTDAQPAPEGATSPEDKRRHAERVQIVRTVETLSQGTEWTASAETMAGLEREWAALGAGNDADISGRYERALRRYHDRRAAFFEAVRKAEEDERRAQAEKERRERERAERAAAARKAEEERAEGKGKGPSRRKEASRSDAPARAAKAAEQPATEAPATEAPATEASAGAPAGEAPAEAQAAMSAEERAAREQEEAKRKEERERKQRERKERDLATLTELVNELEAALASDKRKSSERALQKAEKALEALKLPEGSGELVTRFHTARQAVFVKVQELRDAEDWQRWANVPRQEAIIEKAKLLIADPDEAGLIDKLKAIQAEWKTVGPVPQKKSQELWNLFKSTCDQVYERVKAGRARQSEVELDNLRRKEALCEKVEALAESTDWDETAEQIKHLQREWKAIGPVPRKKADAVWKRFRTACDRFFERRKPHLEAELAERVKNLDAKTALCEKAEALAESSDWEETGAALRALQRDWKSTGPAPRKDADAVYKRFRAACDRFFERRKAHEAAERDARKQRIEALKVEIVAMTGQVTAGEADVAEAARRGVELRGTLRELELGGALREELYRVSGALYRAVLEVSPDAFRGTELDPDTSRQKKQKLLARAEELAPAPQQPVMATADQTPEQVAARLRAALAQNALSSSLATSTDGRSIADSIAELREAWLIIGPVPGVDGEALEERFRTACERALRATGQDGPRARS